MKKVDLHIHSTFCDGKNTIEEIVLKAIENGFDVIGISDHSYTVFDESYCIKKDSISNYLEEINILKYKYRDKICIYAGIEQDFYSEDCAHSFDYKIGSVHYLNVYDTYIPVDESKEILLNDVNKHFNGDIYAYLECYFDTVSMIIDKTHADIIGHLDLISKFNENKDLFDVNNPRYKKAYRNACDKLLSTNKLFEIYTGAISRGYRSTPYPSNEIYEYLKEKGATFILSSDSHSADTIGYLFDEFNKLL